MRIAMEEATRRVEIAGLAYMIWDEYRPFRYHPAVAAWVDDVRIVLKNIAEKTSFSTRVQFEEVRILAESHQSSTALFFLDENDVAVVFFISLPEVSPDLPLGMEG